MLLAKVQIDTQQGEAARRTLRRAVDRHPRYFPAVASLAQLELAAGNAEGALSLAEHARKHQPDSPAGYALEGDVLMTQRHYAQAAKAYDEAAKRGNSGLLVIKTFNARRQAGPVSEAIGPLADWVEANPEDLRARSILAEGYYLDGKLKPAAAQYEAILQRRPNDVAALNNLAWHYSMLGDSRALETAERAYKLQPGDPQVADTLGWLLVQQGQDIDRAVKLLRGASQQVPQSPEIRYHLAAALAKRGDKQEAKALLDGLLESDVDFEGKAEAVKLHGTL